MITDLTDNQNEIPLIQQGFEFQKQALRGLFLLNGTATISLLTFFSSIVLDNQVFAKDLFGAILCFSIGAFIPVICSLILCLKHTFFMDYIKICWLEKFKSDFIEKTMKEEMTVLQETYSLTAKRRRAAEEAALKEIEKNVLYKNFVEAVNQEKGHSKKKLYLVSNLAYCIYYCRHYCIYLWFKNNL